MKLSQKLMLFTATIAFMLPVENLSSWAAQAPADGMESATPATSAQRRQIAKLTERLHQQFMQNEEYAEADALLNATWQLLKTNLSKSEYKEIQASQREWIRRGRAEEAEALMGSHDAADAYAIVIRKRANALAEEISSRPRPGTYKSAEAQFTVSVNGDTVSITGDAFHGQNTCDFDGTGRQGEGWISMRHDDFPDYYLLFTSKGATIHFHQMGETQGCGRGVSFADDYVYSGK